MAEAEKLSLLEKYRDFLPLTEKSCVISLGEGATPLVKAWNLPSALGRKDLGIFFKLEGLNPTGSFKDRGMCLAITKAVEENSRAVICASTGNTSASAAAFAAKAGLKCYVLLPAGKVAMGKLAQALLYGAKTIQVEGNFDQALDLVRELGEKLPLTVVNSINPYRLQGQKTGAFEIFETLATVPDYLCIPVGNAGNISAYFMGFRELVERGKSNAVPRMCGFQAAGAAPIVLGHKVDNPDTIATAIRIGNPASWKLALEAVKESEGFIEAVTDEEILSAYRILASSEGIFCEPASAASVAGLIKLVKQDKIESGSTIACVLTGNGLKDPGTAMESSKVELKPVKADIGALREAMQI